MMLGAVTFLVACTFVSGSATPDQLPSAPRIDESSPRVVCWFDSSQATQNDTGPMPDLPANNCTHIIYEYGILSPTGSILPSPTKTKADLNKILSLRESNHNLKLLLSVGSGQSDDPLATILGNIKLRHHFISDVTNYIYQMQFDGLNIYRKVPLEKDKVNFGLLTKEISCYFYAHRIQYVYTKTFILSMDVMTDKTSLTTGYDFATLKQNVNFFNIMAFDFYHWKGGSKAQAGLQSALKPSKMDPTSPLNVQWVINYMQGKVDNYQQNLVISTFGTSFSLCSLNGQNPYVPEELACGPGSKGPTTNQPGVLAYFEICNLITKNQWTSVVDPTGQTPYAYAPKPSTQWLGYEDQTSAILKVQMAKTLKLGGVGVCDVVLDDSKNICKKGPFPILTAIVAELNK